MNSNGMARGYMARNMSIQEFTKHVTSCIQRELKEENDKIEVILQISNDHFIWELHHEGSTYFALVPKQIAVDLKKDSPYALDRLIWDKLKNVGLKVNEESYYLQTVYN